MIKMDEVKKNIMKLYDRNDGGHDIRHAISVLKSCKSLGKQLDYKNMDLLEVMALGHDCMAWKNRKEHHILGCEYILNNKELREVFTKDEISTIANAIYEHRSKMAQTSIESMILYDADKLDSFSDINRMIERSILYHKEDIKDYNKIFTDVYEHLKDKYGSKKLRLHFDESYNSSNKRNIERILNNKEEFRTYFDRIRIQLID